MLRKINTPQGIKQIRVCNYCTVKPTTWATVYCSNRCEEAARIEWAKHARKNFKQLSERIAARASDIVNTVNS